MNRDQEWGGLTKMPTWNPEQLTRFAEPEEIRIAGRRRDGSLRTPRIVWMVRSGTDLYARSVNGPDAAWFRGTRATQEAHISTDGAEADVQLVDVDADDPVQAGLDDAYRAKYGRRYPGPTASITSPLARAATVKIVPTDEEIH
jgi:hypothetical protein